MAEDLAPAGAELVAIVSCDILGHSTTDGAEQLRRVAAINEIVSAGIRAIPPERVVWSSGGDGGHIVLRGSHAEWQANAIRLAWELQAWARAEHVKLRITGHVGHVWSIWGADGRVQVVGPGINFAGWLLRQFHHEAVVVSGAFRREIDPAQLELDVRFHDERLFIDRHDKPQLLSLMTLGGLESAWVEERDDHTELDRRVEQAKRDRNSAEPHTGWDVVYFAKRIWQVTSNDRHVTKALASIVRTLKSTTENRQSFLASMVLSELKEFVRIGQLIERKKGEIICRYGDPGESMFVIMRGEVGVYNIENQGFGGRAAPRHRHGPGDVVGELASVLNRDRTADLVAMKDVALLAFNYDEVKKSLPATATTEFDRFVVERVLEHVTQVASYLAGANRAGPLSTATKDDQEHPGLETAWSGAVQVLSDHSQLITVDDGPSDLRFDHVAPATGDRRGLYILVSGSVRSPLSAEPDLHGAQCPALFIDLPNLTTKQLSYRRTKGPIKVLRIDAAGIDDLEAAQQERLEQSLEGAAGAVPDQYEYHAYLCHSSLDKELVRQLRDRLETHGIRCWFDEADMPVGSPARDRMERGLRSSRYLLVCASAHLPSARWANTEIDAVMRYDVADPTKPKILVLKLDDDSEEDSIPLLLHGKKWLEYRRPGDFERLVEFLKNPAAMQSGFP